MWGRASGLSELAPGSWLLGQTGGPSPRGPGRVDPARTFRIASGIPTCPPAARPPASSPGAPVSQEWYYSVGGDRQGPVTAAELKKLAEAGTLKATDLVWKDGMPDWVQAKSIKGLFGGSGAV